MSIVSAEVSKDNPITDDDVRGAARALGFEVAENEIVVHRTLLAAAYDTFEELSALPDYDLDVDRDTYPCHNVQKGASGEDSRFGNAWSYRFDLIKAPTRASEGEPRHGLLHGKSVVLKDNICVAGVAQVHGTDAIEPWPPRSDATLVTRILDADGTIVGLATCEAMSCATVSNTASAGPIHNPWAMGYSAGGSSSGVAALVGTPSERPSPSLGSVNSTSAADMGVGADQGGSIRVPAAFCGLVGLKPTHGLVPYTGVTSCEPMMDHVGPMCKTVWDTALLLEAIAGTDGIDDRQIGAHGHGQIKYSTELKVWHAQVLASDATRPLAGRRTAVITEAIEAPFVREEMKAHVGAALHRFKDLGVQVEHISMPLHDRGRSLWVAICRQSLASTALGNPSGRRTYHPTGYLDSLLPWTQDKWDKLPIAMRNELINAVLEQKRYPTLYAKCINLALQLRREYEKLFETFDVLILPAVPFTAPPLFDRETAIPWEVVSSTFGQTLNTMQFNVTGHPAMSFPVGLAPDMTGRGSDVLLPVAVQLVGRLHGELDVLQFGYAYEQAYDWTRNCPGPGVAKS